ncbi:MAG: hypothetical protein AB7E72_05710 [Lysobacterales bacterium]
MPRKSAARKLSWGWELGPNHWMSVTLRPSGLRYIGSDWASQSGGDYAGGFQSLAEFDRDGGLQEMPVAVATEIAQYIAELPRGHAVRIVIVGTAPAEVHYTIDDEPYLRKADAVLFDGALWEGPHQISGMMIFPIANSRRRRKLKFKQHFVVAAAMTLEIPSSVTDTTD